MICSLSEKEDLVSFTQNFVCLKPYILHFLFEIPKMKKDFFIMVGILDKSVIIFKGCDEPLTFSLYISDDHSHSRGKTRIGSFHFTDGKLHLWIK